jgi:hypothetical protein
MPRRLAIVVAKQPTEAFAALNRAVRSADLFLGVDQPITEALVIPFVMIMRRATRHDIMHFRAQALATLGLRKCSVGVCETTHRSHFVDCGAGRVVPIVE